MPQCNVGGGACACAQKYVLTSKPNASKTCARCSKDLRAMQQTHRQLVVLVEHQPGILVPPWHLEKQKAVQIALRRRWQRHHHSQRHRRVARERKPDDGHAAALPGGAAQCRQCNGGFARGWQYRVRALQNIGRAMMRFVLAIVCARCPVPCALCRQPHHTTAWPCLQYSQTTVRPMHRPASSSSEGWNTHQGQPSAG